MAGKSSDFNYKVALASGLKSLQSGRLRQAEEQFRYLVTHFPSAEGGYRGLAKVLLEQQDRASSLKVLLDGGAALAKAGQRDGAINLYKEAIQLDAHDLAAHRRLASSLALAGDNDAAAHEYVRYIRVATEAGDTERARLEATYALERVPHNSEIEAAATGAGVAPAVHDTAPHEATPISTEERESLINSAFGASTAAAPEPAPAAAPWTPSEPAAPEWSSTPAEVPASDTWEGAAPGVDAWAQEPTAAAESNGEPMGADTDETVVEATAARYLAKGDPRGGAAALEAARRYMADGRIDAASDLLLQLIAAGVANHEAQRLLVEVTKNMGKQELAKAKVKLLVEALRLDGRNELAAEVEQLAQAD